MDELGGFLIEAFRRKAAQSLADAQAETATPPAPAAPIRVILPAAAPAAAPPRRSPARPAEPAPARELEPAPLLAPLRGGRALLSAIVVSEVLLPPLSLREPGPHR